MNNGNTEEEKLGLFQSLYLYLKLFLYYPLKYTLVLVILMAVYKLWSQVFEFGSKAFYYIGEFYCKLVCVCTMNKEECKVNLILFDIPNIFHLFRGILELILGIIYLFVAILFFIAGILTFIPFNLIVPSYTAIYYN